MPSEQDEQGEGMTDEERGDYCPNCGKQRIVDAPPFGEMTEKDIEDWHAAGGRISVLECPCGGCEAQVIEVFKPLGDTLPKQPERRDSKTNRG
jgi:hypothetical protein